MSSIDAMQNEVARALERSLDMLGEPSKKALLFHLTHTFKISLDDISMEELESALKEILGESSSLVIASINSELER